ncbi:MAG: hypothetical protein PF961_22170 [Planctomycetota bacterium]|nr:hypothetical protein [Planctomycetota bacterium]
MLRANPQAAPIFLRYSQACANHAEMLADYQCYMARQAEGDPSAQLWRPAPLAPVHPWAPGQLYNGMVRPLLPLSPYGTKAKPTPIGATNTDAC